MKMRAKRKQRTRPRLWELAGSVRCKPYKVKWGETFEVEMDTKRIKLAFFAQDADHSMCLKKLRQEAEKEKQDDT